MKKLFITLLLLTAQITLAQNAMADLKFEEAETAFNNQNYTTTIKHLDEFDKLYGSITAKSLYLRIVSQDKLFEPSKLYEKQDQFTLLTSLRKNASAYLKAMESEGLDDRYREVYTINQKLQQYPQDKATLQAEIQAINDNLNKYVGIYNSDPMYALQVEITKQGNTLFTELLNKTGPKSEKQPLKFVRKDEYIIEVSNTSLKFNPANASFTMNLQGIEFVFKKQ
ncbi:hypothetical protein [Flavobacterium sp. UBA7682]|uniref:hypothetical protein n=1 Tax=Flavobacterium sp. UBA7682 TaxID=1946560 RepID=UPI0025BE1A1F|nr:hypothetical protein [Flavobacterium sp. UBA7682]